MEFPRLKLTLVGELSLIVSGAAMEQKSGASSTLNFRLPTWTHKDGAKGILNNEILSLPTPGNFLSITRKWKAGDKLSLQLPITLRTEAIKDDRSKWSISSCWSHHW